MKSYGLTKEAPTPSTAEALALVEAELGSLFGIPLLAQQVAFTDRPGLDTKLHRRLGLGYQPASSMDAWRARRSAASVLTSC